MCDDNCTVEKSVYPRHVIERWIEEKIEEEK